MSTKTLSPKATSIAGYKKLLIEAEQLRGQAGEAAFKRITLLVAVFDDHDFRHDLGNVDPEKMGEHLDAYLEDLFLKFFQLREMLATYPKQDQWATGRLRRMYDEMLDKRSQPEKQEKKSRASATVAEVEKLKSDIKRLRTQLAQANNRIAELESENSRLKGQRSAA